MTSTNPSVALSVFVLIYMVCAQILQHSVRIIFLIMAFGTLILQAEMTGLLKMCPHLNEGSNGWSEIITEA